MQHKLRFYFCALLLLLLGACACYGVTVTGHDGTQLSLSQIPDIIRHVTGQTSGSLSFKKDSLFIYGVYDTYNEHKDVYSFSIDGSNNNAATYIGLTGNNVSGPLDYQNLAAITTQAVRDSDKGKLVLSFVDEDFSVDDSTPTLNTEGAYVTGNADDGSSNIDDGVFYEVGGEGNPIQSLLVDVKGGMTVNGYDGEVTAYLMRSGATLSVYMGYVYPDNTAYASNAQRADGSWSTTITSDVPTMLDGTVYIPVSMTVGDFDNDGYKNEIAVAYSDRAAVRYVVLQATQTSNSPIYSGFALNVLNNGDVGSYNYNAYFSDGFSNYIYDRYGGQMDGLTVMYSVATATGDFDGDGQSEFAVVWRDTTPNSETFSLPSC